jgi:deoxycytidylate deaminase
MATGLRAKTAGVTATSSRSRDQGADRVWGGPVQCRSADDAHLTSPRHVDSSSPAAGAAANANAGAATGDGPQMIRKREDYISWDDYFMAVAFLSAMRSKDPSTQVQVAPRCMAPMEGCSIDDRMRGRWERVSLTARTRSSGSVRQRGLSMGRGRPLIPRSAGYNGFPIGCSDDLLPWARQGDFLDTKYPYVCHAEMNAILNKNNANVKGSGITRLHALWWV